MPALRLFANCLISLSLAFMGPAEGVTETLAIVGAAAIDVSDFGSSDSDLVDAAVVIEDGTITAVGPRSKVRIPAAVNVLNADGRFIVPGLTDGFAALNNQSYADAYLECGVTSIIAVSGGRRGPLATGLDPSPRVSRLESVGNDPGTLDEHVATLEDLAADGVDVALMMYKLTPEQLRTLIRRAHDLGLATIGELGRTPYAGGVSAGLDAVVHTTRYSLGLAPERMARAVAERPFSDDLESAKWLYYLWLTELSAHDPRLVDYAAILAGPSDLLEGLFHTRRTYGGSLIRGWVYGAVALHFLDGFEDRLQRGIMVSEDLFSHLEKHPSFILRHTPGGSNVFVLEVRGADPKAFRDRLATAGISMRQPRNDGSIVVQVNETWSSITGEELGRRMVAALD